MSVVVPPQRGAEDVQLRLVKEEGGLRIDVPDSITRQQLLEILSRHLEAVPQQKDNWPDDAKDAQRLVAVEMLMAPTSRKRRTAVPDRSSDKDSDFGWMPFQRGRARQRPPR